MSTTPDSTVSTPPAGEYSYDRGNRPFDPPAQLTAWHERAPITRIKHPISGEGWLVTGHAETKLALGDPRLSAEIDRGFNPHRPGPGSNGRGERVAGSGMFIGIDEPEHSRLRRMLTKDFTIKHMETLRPSVERIVTTFLDQLAEREQPVDLVEEFALPIPSLVICELLGIPYEHHDIFQRHSATVISRTATPEEKQEAVIAFREFVVTIAKTKVADPGDDVLTRLVTEQIAVDELDYDQLADIGFLLLIAGHETTANMISLSTVVLAADEQRRAAITSGDPKVVAQAIEELLRYLSIVHFPFERVAIEDLEISGQLVKAGERVMVSLPVANRDGTVYDAANELRLDRTTRNHLAFGFGVHVCLGQPLARLELQIALPALFHRFPKIRPALPLSEIQFRDEMLVYGVTELPVTW